MGRKVSDIDQKWAEKWFEIKCKDATLKDKKYQNIIIKFYSKFWTKREFIEGECCHQVLTDGSKSYTHDGLIFEMKDFYTIDNITKRAPSALITSPILESTQVKLAGLEFGRPKPVTIPQNLNSDNIKNFDDQDVFRIIDENLKEEIVFDEKSQASRKQGINKA